MRNNLLKATKSVALVAAAFLMVTLIGCGGIAGNGISGEIASEKGNRTLTGKITGISAPSARAAEMSGARSIIPNTTGYTTVNNYDYYLYGIASNGQYAKMDGSHPAWIKIPAADISGDSTFTVDVAPYFWDFTLVAVNKDASFTETITTVKTLDDVKTKVLLIGYCVADLTNASTKAEFNLSAKGLETPGTLNIKILLDGWELPSSITKVTVSLKDMLNGTIINGLTKEFSEANSNKLNKDTERPFVDSAATVNAGIYNLVALFEGEGISEEWSDDIRILPGRETKNVVKIPTFLGKQPPAPENFKAHYIDPSKSAVPGKYDVVFEWTCAATNEREFVIEIADVSDTSTKYILRAPSAGETQITDTVWVASSPSFPSKTYASSIISSRDPAYVAGSLFANNTTVTLRLDLGKRYVARICARSKAGNESSWKAVELDSTTFTDDSEMNFGGDCINVFSITYDLKGGTYHDFSSGSDVSIENEVVQYGSDSTNILAPTTPPSPPTSATSDYLMKGSANFSKWLKKDDDSDFTSSSHSGPTNLELYATYVGGASNHITIFDARDYKLNDYIKLEGNAIIPLTKKTDYSEVTISDDDFKTVGSSDKQLIWTIEPPNDYTYISISGDKCEFDGPTIIENVKKFAPTAPSPVGPIKFTQKNCQNLTEVVNIVITAFVNNETITYPILLYIEG